MKKQLPKNTPKPHDSILQPGSLIFNKNINAVVNMNNYFQWWIWKIGANWKHPEGPDSTIKDKDNFPVVHIALEDALAYCKWSNRRLPTEAEWEAAAQGTNNRAIFTWGDNPTILNSNANTWHAKRHEDLYKGLDKALDELGMKDNTIVIFTSDHGSSLMEHNRWSKHNLFRVENRVPLMIRVPGMTSKGRSESFAELIDLYPTITELLGLKTPNKVEGVSLVQNLKNPELITKSVAYSRIWNGDLFVSTNHLYAEWKGEESGHVYDKMLYDLKKDSLEMNNLANDTNYYQLTDSLSQNITFKKVF